MDIGNVKTKIGFLKAWLSYCGIILARGLSLLLVSNQSIHVKSRGQKKGHQKLQQQLEKNQDKSFLIRTRPGAAEIPQWVTPFELVHKLRDFTSNVWLTCRICIMQ